VSFRDCLPIPVSQLPADGLDELAAMLTAARESQSSYDFALVAMLGLLGLVDTHCPGHTIRCI